MWCKGTALVEAPIPSPAPPSNKQTNKQNNTAKTQTNKKEKEKTWHKTCSQKLVLPIFDLYTNASRNLDMNKGTKGEKRSSLLTKWQQHFLLTRLVG